MIQFHDPKMTYEVWWQRESATGPVVTRLALTYETLAAATNAVARLSSSGSGRRYFVVEATTTRRELLP
jgi:hypothetical protein